MTPNLNETVQMRGHNMWFYAELTKSIPHYHQILLYAQIVTILHTEIFVTFNFDPFLRLIADSVLDLIK